MQLINSRISSKLFSYLLIFTINGVISVSGQNTPQWVSNRPLDNSYYIGIGQATKIKVNYLEQARILALEDLASQIEVNISASTFLHQFESDRQFKEEFRSYVITRSNLNITEYETVDSWENTDTYWVFIRLSKEAYRKKRDERKLAATSLATDFYLRAIPHKDRGEFIESTKWLAKAFEAISEFADEPVRVKIDERNIILQNEVYYTLTQVLSKITLTSGDSESIVKLDWFTAKDHQTIIKVNSNEEAPISFSLFRHWDINREDTSKENEVELTANKFLTSRDGSLNLYPASLHEIFTPSDKRPIKIIMQASLDLDQLINSSYPRFFFQTLSAPSLQIKFFIKKKYIILEESNDKFNDACSDCNIYPFLNSNLFPFVFVNKIDLAPWMDAKDKLVFNTTCGNDGKIREYSMEFNVTRKGERIYNGRASLCTDANGDCCDHLWENKNLELIEKLKKFYYQ